MLVRVLVLVFVLILVLVLVLMLVYVLVLVLMLVLAPVSVGCVDTFCCLISQIPLVIFTITNDVSSFALILYGTLCSWVYC